MYQELTNLYYDFINSNNQLSNSLSYLTSSILSRSIINFDFAFEFVSKTYGFFIIKDIDKMYEKNILIEIIFSLTLLFVLTFIIIYVFYRIDKGNNQYKKLLQFILKMYYNNEF